MVFVAYWILTVVHLMRFMYIRSKVASPHHFLISFLLTDYLPKPFHHATFYFSLEFEFFERVTLECAFMQTQHGWILFKHASSILLL